MERVLEALGWGPFFDAQVAPGERAALRAGRAVADRGRRLLVRFEDGESLVTIPGRFRARGVEPPVVGDFVLAERGEEPPVVRVLRRRTRLSRGVAGRRSDEQVLVANVDLVFVVQGVDGGVKPRRVERTLAAVRASGADPVVLVTKIDLLDLREDREAVLQEAQGAAGTAQVLAVSVESGEGQDALRALLASGRTAVFVGPSGAGKSTLVNALVGADVQETEDVRASDARGRHRTSGRRLFLVPGGGAVIDGPGVRELKLWDPEGIEAAYEDVVAVAARCRFSDCRHADEPGCAVRAAVHEGSLDAERLAGLRKLEGEAQAAAARRLRGAQAAGAPGGRAKALARAVRRTGEDDEGEEDDDDDRSPEDD
jgi:ribosome biogenesis GTPase